MKYNNREFVNLFTREITIQRLEVFNGIASNMGLDHTILIPTGNGIFADFWFRKDQVDEYSKSSRDL